jgi:hypothetical protein
MTSTASTAKAFVSQVHEAAARASQGSTPSIQGTDCSRFWLQGVVVGVSGDRARCTLDDGTGVVPVDLRTFRKSIPAGMATPLALGDLVMIIGPLVRRSSSAGTMHLSPMPLSDPESEASTHAILAHQVMVVTEQPQQDAIWFLEVIEYWRTARS